MSTYGIPQIAGRIGEIRRARDLGIRCLGVVVTKFQSNSSQHKQGLARLPDDLRLAFHGAGEVAPPILSTVMPQTNAAAEAMTYERSVGTYADKYGRGTVAGHPAYRYGVKLAEEIEWLLET